MPGLLRFLVGRFFYSDAVNTLVVVMSVVAVKAVGLTGGERLLTSITLTVVAVVASFGWGWLVDHYGPKKTLDRGPVLVDRRPAARRRRRSG